VRDLEQQLAASHPGADEELPGASGVLQKTSSQGKNLSHIRTMEREKREAFEVWWRPTTTEVNPRRSFAVDTSRVVTFALLGGFFWTEAHGGVRGPVGGQQGHQEEAGGVQGQGQISHSRNEDPEGSDINPSG